MCRFDSFKRSAPEGIIAPNIRSSAERERAGGSSRRSAFRPQKVKNIDTSSPIATAPLARMNAASTLSSSPEKTTNDFLSSSLAAAPLAAATEPLGSAVAPPLRIRAA